MESFAKYLPEYKKQLQQGAVRNAYRGLMEYFSDLRLHLHKAKPEYYVSGSVSTGLMDYSYFYFSPTSLKQRKLKIALFFIHDTLQFEIWLAGYNKNVQAKFQELFAKRNWRKNYSIAAKSDSVDYIMKAVLIANPHFYDLKTLTERLEKGIEKFIEDVEGFLARVAES